MLRAGLLALLVLGLLIRPMVSGLSEAHAVEHALAMDEHAGRHGHSHDHGGGAHRHDNAPGEDHHSAIHELMHQPGGHAGLTLTAGIEVPPALRHTQPLPDRIRSGFPRQPPSTPFRPPIA